MYNCEWKIFCKNAILPSRYLLPNLLVRNGTSHRYILGSLCEIDQFGSDHSHSFRSFLASYCWYLPLNVPPFLSWSSVLSHLLHVRKMKEISCIEITHGEKEFKICRDHMGATPKVTCWCVRGTRGILPAVSILPRFHPSNTGCRNL